MIIPFGFIAPPPDASLNGTHANHTRARVGPCLAGVHLKNDGVEYAVPADGVGDGDALSPHWLLAGGLGSFWARCTHNSGDALDAASSATGSWLALSTSRSWYINEGSPGTKTANITVEIATDSGGADVTASETYDLSAQNISV